MDLKALLGEELYNQVIEKAGDNKLAVVNNGEWFPKEKFDTVNNDNKDLKQQLKDRDTQLDGLKGKAKDNDDLLKQIQDLQDANKQTATDYQEKLDKQSFEFALDKALSAATARNPKAVKALLDRESIKLDGEKLLGLEDQLSALKESDAYLFGDEQPPGLKGRQPNYEGGNPPPIKDNPFKKETFNLTEQGKLIRDEPEKAKQLISQAGGNPALYGL
ncbi:phage scaffolding protein [Bacillus solitudinis]|uniref:phage scaffolding protein n=1 Tax=Bacillus solitudinis TaxID=2014074 RepID=UPI000C23086D|nr:phage scaffolding protein [Bacillus solitudinis]